jgi:hypothetical protein
MAWVQGFRRLKDSASTDWLYAIAEVRGLRMKEPPGSAQQFCRDMYTEAKSAAGRRERPLFFFVGF